MLELPAYRVLSLSAHRILSRIEVELAHHAGNDNGQLPCTFDHFVEYGVDRHSIAPAVRELQALGFITVEPGAAGNAEHRRPNLYGLTYNYFGGILPTDDWKRIKNETDAAQIARRSRRTSRPRVPPFKIRNPVGNNALTLVGETHIENPKSPVGKPPLQAR